MLAAPFVFVMLLAGCITTKPLDNKVANNLPTTFKNSADTTNSVHINWKNYFADSNLVALLNLAVINNPDVLVALQRIEIAKATVYARKGLLFPTVSGNVSYWQRKFGYYTMDDAGNRTTEIEPGKIIPTHLPDFFVGLQTSWEVDIWGKNRNKRKAALLRYVSTVQGKNAAITNLVADVALNYYKLLTLDNELDIIRETIRLQENAAELVKL